jgi:hypothetical protein
MIMRRIFFSTLGYKQRFAGRSFAKELWGVGRSRNNFFPFSGYNFIDLFFEKSLYILELFR